MSVLRAIHEEKYVRLTTSTRDGRKKHIPVWIALISDKCIGFTTVQNSWKVKRILREYLSVLGQLLKQYFL